jgi:hypothetical protein
MSLILLWSPLFGAADSLTTSCMFYFFRMISRQADRRPRLPNQPIRACLKGWHVGSAALLGAHLRVWPPFPLPRSGPREAKPPPPPGSSRTPFSTVAGGLAPRDVGRVICAGGRWPWRARTGEGKVPPALLRREIHCL